MEPVGCLPFLIAAFAAIGALFTGNNSSGPPEPAVATRPETVELRLTIDASAATKIVEGDPAALINDTLKVLKARFPSAKVTRVDGAAEPTVELSVIGPSRLTDTQLRRLATLSEELRFLMVAREEDTGAGVDLAKQRRRATDYAERHGGDLASYNLLPPADGGPAKGLSFAWQGTGEDDRWVVALRTSEEAKALDSSIIDRVFLSYDHNDRPALGFDIREEDQDRFEAFTGAHIDQQMAVVLGTEILTSPNLNGPLRTGGIITSGGSGFQKSDIEFFVQMLDTPPLPLRLKLRSIERRR